MRSDLALKNLLRKCVFLILNCTGKAHISYIYNNNNIIGCICISEWWCNKLIDAWRLLVYYYSYAW